MIISLQKCCCNGSVGCSYGSSGGIRVSASGGVNICVGGGVCFCGALHGNSGGELVGVTSEFIMGKHTLHLLCCISILWKVCLL